MGYLDNELIGNDIDIRSNIGSPKVFHINKRTKWVLDY